MPTATDLVTDLPADFEVFGQAVATSMADLLGGTSGQILAKNSNTDMDFVWIANDQGDITGITASSPLTGGGTSGAVTVGIQDALTTQKGAVQLSDSTSTTSSILAATPTAVKAAYDLANTANTTAGNAIAKSTATAKGNVFTATAASTPAVLAVGANDSVLTAASGEATGLKFGGLSTSFTPTWTNLTVGNGTNTASYVQVGKIVTLVGKIVFGTTTSITGHPQFTLPITAKDTSGIPGLVEYADLGVAGWFGHMFFPSTTTVNFWTINVASTYPSWASVSSTVPFTFGSGDFFMYRLTYEVA